MCCALGDALPYYNSKTPFPASVSIFMLSSDAGYRKLKMRCYGKEDELGLIWPVEVGALKTFRSFLEMPVAFGGEWQAHVV